MQRLEVSGAVRPIYGSLGVKLLRRNVDLIQVVRAEFLPTFSLWNVTVLRDITCHWV